MPSARAFRAAHATRRRARVGRGDPSPRAGNALDVLIEGAAYLPALAQAIRDARRSVLIAGWCITPGLALVRDEPPVLLRELLGEAVRVG
jgi:phosphatidylserine/phosphatidylglycerophosphate/cardiolipin synthase-like enzyme